MSLKEDLLASLLCLSWPLCTSCNQKGTHEPSVSVLIPAHNEEVGIQNAIQSIIDSAYPKLGIIIVNDGQTDRTHALVSKFIRNAKSKTRAVFRYKRLANGGKARALNDANLWPADLRVSVLLPSDLLSKRI